MDIIDHGHKNKCEFSMIPIGEPFRDIFNQLCIKNDESHGTILKDGRYCGIASSAIVYTVKAHVEVH